MLYLASDHAGYELKEKLKQYLSEEKIAFEDLGTNSTDSVDYSDFGHTLAKKVLENSDSRGVGICGTGLGISMALNRHDGIRAARSMSVEDAHLARQHNGSNVLVLAGRQTDSETAKKMLAEFLKTPFEGGRHGNRIRKIDL
jgi:ribose 5-phosphate isomerase B